MHGEKIGHHLSLTKDWGGQRLSLFVRGRVLLILKNGSWY